MALPAPKKQDSEENKPGRGVLLAVAQTNKPELSFKDIIVKPVVVNVFFDGTKNNLYNIDARAKYAKQIAEEKSK